MVRERLNDIDLTRTECLPVLCKNGICLDALHDTHGSLARSKEALVDQCPVEQDNRLGYLGAMTDLEVPKVSGLRNAKQTLFFSRNEIIGVSCMLQVCLARPVVQAVLQWATVRETPYSHTYGL